MSVNIEALNALGQSKGFGGCEYCGDRWNWKKYKTIRIDERLGMFPLCEECFEKLPIKKIEECIWRLADSWTHFHPEDAALYYQQALKAIENARKMKEEK